MTTTDLTARAMQLAESDLEFIRQELMNIRDTDSNIQVVDGKWTRVSMCIVDGTQYSPSWRALDGGFDLWNRLQILTPERAEEMQMAYEETLDAGTDALGLYWEDGCLWAPEEEK